MKLVSIITIVLTLNSVVTSQTITVIEKYADLAKMFSSPDTSYIVNYWAIWCGPCVKELPHFYTLAENLKGTKNKVILVSLDFKSQLDKKVIPFFEKNPTSASVYLLADKDYDSYIGLVHPDWEGPIPITVVIQNNTKIFTDQEFETLDQLYHFINPLLTLK